MQKRRIRLACNDLASLTGLYAGEFNFIRGLDLKRGYKGGYVFGYTGIQKAIWRLV